jgi:hypothetical protein
MLLEGQQSLPNYAIAIRASIPAVPIISFALIDIHEICGAIG